MEEKRTYNILVYGIERKGLTAPSEITERNYKLVFEPFDTKSRFNDYDGVILFQGIFEEFRSSKAYYTSSSLIHKYNPNELDKRKKELNLLLKSKGFVCFILCEGFIDRDGTENYEATDLAKHYLNFSYFYRKNFSDRVTYISTKRSEFDRFLELYGAASSYFQNSNEHIEWKIIAEFNQYVVGMVIWNQRFFIPSLLPENVLERVEEYFKLLAEALTSTVNKLIYDVPAWVEEFEFPEEEGLAERKNRLVQEVQEIQSRLQKLRSFKRILLLGGDSLVDDVVETLRDGFGFKVDSSDDYREDIKIVDANDKPTIFGEIKGTNRGVKREHVNQADSHRERAELPSDFPTILVVNTHIKNSRNLQEKDKPVPTEQIRHADRNKVLVIRTLDLLRLLSLKLDGKVSQDQLLDLLMNSTGWLRVSDSGWEVVKS